MMKQYKIKPSHSFQKWNNKLIYGKWVENGRPGKSMYNWYSSIRRQRIKIYEHKSWWNTLSDNNVHSDPVVYFFITDENEALAYQVYIEHNGFQHMTFDCNSNGIFQETAIYPMTDYMNVKQHVVDLNKDVRTGWMKKKKLKKDQYTITPIGDKAFIIKFKTDVLN